VLTVGSGSVTPNPLAADKYTVIDDGEGPIVMAVAAVCGDGERAASEPCDDGNTESGDCCHADCTLEAAGAPCGSQADDACLNPDQ
jgi:cysteine-rich repeat protein